MAYKFTWDAIFEAKPDDQTFISAIAQYIRYTKEAIRETFQTLRWNMDAAWKTISRAVLKNTALAKVSDEAAVNYTIDVSTGPVFVLTLTEDTTIAFTNIPSSGYAEFYVVAVQDATGGRALTWPTLPWDQDVEPSPVTAAGTMSLYVIAAVDGTVISGEMAGTGYPA